MKVGDLVLEKDCDLYSSLFGDSWRRFGLILEWYDTPKQLVTVGWWCNGKLEEVNPRHVSNLRVISHA